MSPHKTNLQGLTKIFLELFHMKGNIHRKNAQKADV